MRCSSRAALPHQPQLIMPTMSRPPLQMKGTVLLMPSGSDKITTAPSQPIQSERSCTDEGVKELLSQSLKNKKKKNKKVAAA